jgi:hypothetical protein
VALPRSRIASAEAVPRIRGLWDWGGWGIRLNRQCELCGWWLSFSRGGRAAAAAVATSADVLMFLSHATLSFPLPLLPFCCSPLCSVARHLRPMSGQGSGGTLARTGPGSESP